MSKKPRNSKFSRKVDFMIQSLHFIMPSLVNGPLQAKLSGYLIRTMVDGSLLSNMPS